MFKQLFESQIDSLNIHPEMKSAIKTINNVCIQLEATGQRAGGEKLAKFIMSEVKAGKQVPPEVVKNAKAILADTNAHKMDGKAFIAALTSVNSYAHNPNNLVALKEFNQSQNPSAPQNPQNLTAKKNPTKVQQPAQKQAAKPAPKAEEPVASKPEQTTAPAEQPKPAEQTAAPAEEAKPAEQTAAPAEETKPAEQTAAPAEETKPAEQTAAPAEEAKPAEQATAPAEEAKPAEQATAPAEEAKPAEQPKAKKPAYPSLPEDQVKRVQTYLNEQTGGNLTVDGKLGPKTTEALQQFAKIKVDKIFGPKTKKAFDDTLKKAQDNLAKQKEEVTKQFSSEDERKEAKEKGITVAELRQQKTSERLAQARGQKAQAEVPVASKPEQTGSDAVSNFSAEYAKRAGVDENTAKAFADKVANEIEKVCAKQDIGPTQMVQYIVSKYELAKTMSPGIKKGIMAIYGEKQRAADKAKVAQKNAQQPAQQQAQKPAQQPAQKPAQQQAQQPAQKPAQQQAQQPAQQQAQQPAQQQAQQPAQQQANSNGSIDKQTSTTTPYKNGTQTYKERVIHNDSNDKEFLKRKKIIEDKKTQLLEKYIAQGMDEDKAMRKASEEAEKLI